MLKFRQFDALRKRWLALCATLFCAILSSPLAALAQNNTSSATTPAKDAAKEAAKNPLPPWRQVIEEISALDVFHIEPWRLVAAAFALLLGFAMRTYLLSRVLKPFEKIAGRTDTEIDDRIISETRRPLGWLINILGIYLAVIILQLPPGLQAGVLLILHTVGVVFVAWMLYNAVEVVAIALDRFTERTDSEMDDHLVPLVRKILRIAIIIVTVITIIQQWGYDVTSLIAGLGLGGLAFALAAPQTLANLFGSLMSFTDRPFTLGDWIKTSHGEGVVEEIGLRSTKIRTFTKSLISVPNADIASAPVENFAYMNLRRIKTTVGLTYSTTPEQMEYVVEGIKDLIREEPGMYKEAFYVNFVEFSASSLDVMIYCFTETTNWGEFLAIRQRFYLNIMRLVKEAGSDFAFPSQSLYVENPIGLYEQKASGAPPRLDVPQVVEDFVATRSVQTKTQRKDLGDTDDGMSADGEG